MGAASPADDASSVNEAGRFIETMDQLSNQPEQLQLRSPALCEHRRPWFVSRDVGLVRPITAHCSVRIWMGLASRAVRFSFWKSVSAALLNSSEFF